MKPILHILCMAAVACLAASAHAQLTVTNDLTVWLKADAGVTTAAGNRVMNWADQSGNGNNAAPYFGFVGDDRPTYVANGLNSLPVLHWNSGDYPGDDLLLANPLDLSGGLSIFIVARNEDRRNYNGLFRLRPTNTGDPFIGSTDLYIYWNVGAANNGDINYVANPSTYPSPYGNLLGSGSPGTLNNAYLYDVIASAASATSATQRFDQVDIPSSTAGSNTMLPTNTVAYGVIGVFPAAGDALHGDIAEILIYDSALSAADRDSVESYLYNKWFVVVPEPSALVLVGLGGLVMLLRRR